MSPGPLLPSAIARSLRYKVLALILVSTLVALLVSAFVLFNYETRQYRQFLVRDAFTQGDIVARASAPAVQFDDPIAAAENLASLAGRPDIVAAAIYESDGTLFARYLRDGASFTFPERAIEPGLYFTGEVLELGYPIRAGGEALGTVYLRSKHDRAERQLGFVLLLGLTTLMGFGVAGLLAVYLLRGVTGPVVAVTGVARKVIEERDFTLRAERTTDDEIGVLVDSFNAMLAEVGRMTEALESTNRRLLDETEERRSAEAALRLADRRKDEFLATLAHELRNPLAPMVNAVRLLEAHPDKDAAEQAHGMISRQLAQMVRLVDDLLDASRITLGKLTVHKATVELAGIVRNGVETARQLIDARGHTLDIELPPEPVFVYGDEVRLSQVFANLLTNAAKYTAPGGRLALSATVTGRRLDIEVRDNGIGMSRETLAAVFDMFAQGGHIAGEHARAGLGVGLSLARRLVQMHGGTLEAASPGLGQGSTFRVRLEVCDPPAVAAEPASDDLDAVCADARHKILLVDDNVDFVASMALLLEGLGYEVRVAHRAAAALESAREMRPNAAFLDIGLPDMNGYELAQRLRRAPATSATVLIALSGWGQDKDREASRRAGFACHLIKPVDLESMQATLATYLEAERV